MKITLDNLIAIGALSLSLVTNLILGAMWYVNTQRSTERKQYAAERDFNHLKRNQEQISTGLGHILEEMERNFLVIQRDVLEMKILLGIRNRKLADDYLEEDT